MKEKIKERGKRLYWSIVMGRLDGVGVIEVILILVVIIGLVLIIRNQIEDIMKKAFASITNDSTGITTELTVE